MRLVRIVAVTAVLAAPHLATPVTGWAQVDPCSPVPIPELCDILPSPSPTPPPVPGETGGGDGTGGETGGGATGGGQTSSQDEGGDQGAKANEQAGAAEETSTTPPISTGPFVVSSPNNSGALVETLAPLARYGVPLQQALLKVVGPFPIAGLSYWTDDWHACRDGCTRLHEGLDMFAEAGTPLVAIADGYVSQLAVGDLSGTSVEITDAQGVQYFYAHLSSWAEGLRVGQQVQVGQVLGYVGNTGNAIFTPPHLHLEVQPGGIPVPPKPFVDKWLKVAEAEALALVARTTGRPIGEVTASNFRLTRLFDLTGGGEAPEGGTERMLLLAGIQPPMSSLQLARSTLEQMAWEIHWGGQADAQLAELAEEYRQLAAQQDLADASPWAPFGTLTAPVGVPITTSDLLEVGD